MVEYFDNLESGLCRNINALSRRVAVCKFFGIVSLLGDRLAYIISGTICAIALGDRAAVFVVHALLTAVAGLAVYRFLKERLVRERPYITYHDIVCGTAPLDRYSFPSGHTLHAVSFAVLFSAYVPESILIMAPFAVLVAISRVVLGLHYPSDVIAGAVLGGIIATASLGLLP